MTDSVHFALVLNEMEGVGRVTAGRLLAAFSTYEGLLRFPREQVLARLKGTARAQTLVNQLFDREAMGQRFATAREQRVALLDRGIDILARGHQSWPSGLRALPRPSRPFLLYAYGHPSCLSAPLVALFARPPLTENAFEQAQQLVRHLAPHGILPATGCTHGFDVVVHKVSTSLSQPSVWVAPCGMARVDRPLRPAISATVRAGGLLLSPFSLAHGPYAHDDRDRAYLQAALAGASVFIEPHPHTTEAEAMAWCLEQGRPVFGIAAPEHPLPAAVHPLREATDYDWVVASTRVEDKREEV